MEDPNNQTSILEKAQRLYEEHKFPEALKEFTRLAKSGNTHAQIQVGYMCHYGEGTSQSYQDAKDWYVQATSAGSPDAEYYLGILHFDQNSYEKGLNWFEKAARKGFLPAQFRLGFAYYHGRGVPMDKDKAAAYLSQASDKGHVYSQALLAKKLLSEPGIVNKTRGAISTLKCMVLAAWLGWKDPNSLRIRH